MPLVKIERAAKDSTAHQLRYLNSFVYKCLEILVKQKGGNEVVLVFDDVFNYVAASPDLVVSKCAIDS